MNLQKSCLAAALAVMCGSYAHAGSMLSYTFDISGLDSTVGYSDAFFTELHDFGIAGTIVGADIDVNYESFAPSWRTDAIISLDATGSFYDFAPLDYGAPRSPGLFAYADSVPLSIPSDGNVAITLWESVDDTLNDSTFDPDATYGDGSSVTVYFDPIPEPTTYALLVAGVVGIAVLRRRG